MSSFQFDPLSAVIGAAGTALVTGFFRAWGKDAYAAIKKALDRSPEATLVPIPDAGRRIYERLRNRPLGKYLDKNFAGGDGSRMLCVLGHHIALTSVDLLGRHPPSETFEPINKAQLPGLQFINGGRELRRYGDAEPTYFDLSIRKGDLRKALKEIEAASDGLGDGFI